MLNKLRALLFVVVCSLAVVLPLQAAEQQTGGARLTFDQSECDLGEVLRSGDKLTYTFRFVNDGSEPLVILSVTTTCSCLKAEYSRKPIAVGASGEIVVTIEPKKVEKGLFRRVIQIRSNSTGGIEILTIKGIAKD